MRRHWLWLFWHARCLPRNIAVGKHLGGCASWAKLLLLSRHPQHLDLCLNLCLQVPLPELYYYMRFLTALTCPRMLILCLGLHSSGYDSQSDCGRLTAARCQFSWKAHCLVEERCCWLGSVNLLPERATFFAIPWSQWKRSLSFDSIVEADVLNNCLFFQAT